MSRTLESRMPAICIAYIGGQSAGRGKALLEELPLVVKLDGTGYILPISGGPERVVHLIVKPRMPLICIAYIGGQSAGHGGTTPKDLPLIVKPNGTGYILPISGGPERMIHLALHYTQNNKPNYATGETMWL